MTGTRFRVEVQTSTDLFIQELRLSYVQYKLRAWGKRDTILGQYCGTGHAPQILGIFEIAKIFTKYEQLL